MILGNVIRATLYAFLALPLLSPAAQSGRVVEKPPAPTPQSTPPGRVNVKPNVDSNSALYKLVFPMDYEGKTRFLHEREEELMDATRRSRFNEFVRLLNEAGSQGYKLTSLITSGLAIALFKLDETQYEYDWFETDSRLAFTVGAFEERYRGLTGRGFRLADHSLLSRFCEDIDPDNSVGGEECRFKHLFLVERQKGLERPGQFERVGSVPVRGSKPAVELTTRVKEKQAEGFYPTGLLSAFEVLMERPLEGDAGPDEEPDVRVVRASSFWERDNLEEKVNEWARQGYRMAMVNNRIAVMYRPAGAATPVTYVWVKARDKRLEQRLAQLRERGAVYRLTYPDDEGDETRLIFEQGSGGGPPHEYKVLTFEFKVAEDAEALKVHVDLAPSGREALKSLNRLVNEGFSVRDLFYADNAGVILERPL